jgi:hypothetical protein
MLSLAGITLATAKYGPDSALTHDGVSPTRNPALLGQLRRAAFAQGGVLWQQIPRRLPRLEELWLWLAWHIPKLCCMPSR